MEETLYEEKLTAQEQLEEGWIDPDEYQDWLSSIEEERHAYYEEDW